MINVSRETRGKLDAFASLLLEENTRQNLISKATENDLWARHIEDGLQLVHHAPDAESWADIGSGPGLPGLVIAIASGLPTTLVEPRPLRVDFLRRAVTSLALEKVSIVQGKADVARGKFDAITARAVAKAPDLLRITMHLSHAGTRWVLPKGRTVQSELEALESTWQGVFRVEPSLTDPEAGILIAERVRPRGKR